MFGIFVLFFLFRLIGLIEGKSENGPCKISMSCPNVLEFNCMGLISIFDQLEKAPANTTEINIINSNIANVPRHSFLRFGATLENLDLHNSGITSIDVYGFTGLVQLKKLILAENKLVWITAEWFKHLANLQHLDISFNQVLGMDIVFYQMLPNLENFYFDYNQMQTIDYNMFPLLNHLKNVKFGKNPWNWGYRILLTWQLDNQRVNYQDDWEEWGWMSNVVRECQDSGQGSSLSETILDCVILKFLRMEVGQGHTLSLPGTQKIVPNAKCLHEAIVLIRCSMPSSTSRPGRESVRKTFEGLSATFKDMGRSSGKFNSNLFG